MTTPFFSVVIPTYNRAEKLIVTIKTVLKQVFTDFEIIVVNDGSTDNTTALLENNFHDERLIILSRPNRERGSARNTGFKHSHGNYVVFFDSDDIMHDDHLEVLHKNIIQQQFPAFIANKFDFINEDDTHHPSDMRQLKSGYYDYKLFLSGNPLACNVAVNRSTPGIILFEEDRKYAIKEDWMFLINNMQKHKLFITGETTISMLDHSERSMRSDNNIIVSKTLLAQQWILKNVTLNKHEISELVAHVNFFCGIHSYLDNNKKVALKYSAAAIKAGGLKYKYLLLLIKSLIGRKIIRALK